MEISLRARSEVVETEVPLNTDIKTLIVWIEDRLLRSESVTCKRTIVEFTKNKKKI